MDQVFQTYRILCSKEQPYTPDVGRRMAKRLFEEFGPGVQFDLEVEHRDTPNVPGMRCPYCGAEVE